MSDKREIAIPYDGSAGYSRIQLAKREDYGNLAEYIDNSLQSYAKHKSDTYLESIGIGKREALKYKEKKIVTVVITINAKENSMSIEDDAWGIYPNEIERALVMGTPAPILKDGTPQLSRHGMGMKEASFWNSNTWSIETANFNEKTKRIYNFSLEDIMNFVGEVPTVTELKQDNSRDSSGEMWHGTKIKLTNMNSNTKLFNGKSRSTTIQCILDIYQYYLIGGWIQNGVKMGPALTLKVITIDSQGESFSEEVGLPEMEIRNRPVYYEVYKEGTNKKVKERTKENYRWEKKFSLTFGKENYTANGWFAIKSTGSGIKGPYKGGTRIFQAGRVIVGPFGTHRPRIIYGGEASNTTEALYILGHIHIDQKIRVGPTKDYLMWESYSEDQELSFMGRKIQCRSYEEELYLKIKILLEHDGTSWEESINGKKVEKKDALNASFPFDLLHTLKREPSVPTDPLPPSAPKDMADAGSETENVPSSTLNEQPKNEDTSVADLILEQEFDMKEGEHAPMKIKISVVEYINNEETLFLLRSSDQSHIHIEIQLSHAFCRKFRKKTHRQIIGRMACAAIYAQYYIEQKSSNDTQVVEITKDLMRKYNHVLTRVFSGEDNFILMDALAEDEDEVN